MNDLFSCRAYLFFQAGKKQLLLKSVTEGTVKNELSVEKKIESRDEDNSKKQLGLSDYLRNERQRVIEAYRSMKLSKAVKRCI